ncbi:MAG: T9SS type A sorting domain-containing protein [Bacteroidota bacterium]
MKRIICKLLFVFLLSAITSPISIWSQGDHSTTPGGGATNFMFGSTTTTKFQFIYFNSDFTTPPPSGVIERLWFQRTTSTASTSLQDFNDFEIRLGNTTETTLDGLNFFDGLELVYDGALTIPPGPANSWFFIELQTPFTYDNSQTLILETRLIAPGPNHSTGFGVRWTDIANTGDTDRRLQSTDNAAAQADVALERYHVLGLSISPAMPIGLLSFSARANDKQVDINWATSFEENNEFFAIERSRDGIDWNTISTLNSSGDSQSDRHYSTSDKSPLDGISFYRLKQNDFDGQYSYSPIARVLFNRSGDEDVLVYPNPSSDFMYVSGLPDEPDKFQLVNAIGQDVTDAVVFHYEREGSLRLDMSRLDIGIYYLRTEESAMMLVKR